MDRIHVAGTRLVFVLCLALALPSVARAAYSQADLAGTYRFNSIASGPGAPWWERALAQIGPSGAFTALSTPSVGTPDTIAGNLFLDPNGIVSYDGWSTFHGALDLGRTVVVVNDTWGAGVGAGTTELKIGVRTVGATVLGELAGNWEMNSIASGPGAPWWIRGRLAIAPNGSFTGTLTEIGGSSGPASGSFTVAPDGAVTLSIANNALGWLDAGRSVLVLTNTWPDGSPGTAELVVALKMAASYAPSDLAGTWELHSLATGPGAPWWNHGQIVVGTNGAYSGSMLESTGSSHPVSGTFTLAPNGVIARSGSTAARGALDAGRTVMVWTDTWTTGSPGTSEMLVGVRTGGSTAGVDPAALAFALEPVRPNPARGSLAVRFTLARPGDARLELLDVAGRAIESRDVGALGVGAHAVELALGERVRPGLYFVRLRQGASERITRVSVLR